jgi:protein phosphatase 1L
LVDGIARELRAQLRNNATECKGESTDAQLLQLVSSLTQCSLQDKMADNGSKSATDRKEEETKELLQEPSTQLLSQIIQKETLRVDQQLCDQLRSRSDIAGTTSLLAARLPKSNVLLVANVGDSRGVLCDRKGTAVALSHDHKPNYVRLLYNYLFYSIFINYEFL